MSKHNYQKFLLLIFSVLFLSASDAVSQDIAGGGTPRARRTFKLQLEVTTGVDKVEGAKVILVSEEVGVSFSRETRTNQNGIASASSVPEGRVKIQVIAKECETFGSVINLSQDNQMVQVSLVKRAPSPSPSP